MGSCVVCGAHGLPRGCVLCRHCRHMLPRYAPHSYCRICECPIPRESDICAKCLHDGFTFDFVRSALPYFDDAAQLVKALKFHKLRNIARDFGIMLAQTYNQKIVPMGAQFDYVLPVPLHSKRLRERGYNQAELIAQEFARRVHLPCLPHIMVRDRPGFRQSDLTYSDRQKFASFRSFKISDSFLDDVRGARILLVDDVITTGITLGACARTLIRARAAKVACLCVCRALPKPQFLDLNTLLSNKVLIPS